MWIDRRVRCLYLSLFYMDESAVLVVGAVDSWITTAFVPGFAVFAGGILWRIACGFPRSGAGFPPGDLWISSATILIPNLSRSYPRFCPGNTATLHTIYAYYPQPCPQITHRPISLRGLPPGCHAVGSPPTWVSKSLRSRRTPVARRLHCFAGQDADAARSRRVSDDSALSSA